MELTSKQRKYLRSKAHHLKPVIIIGKTKINQSIIDTIDNALKSHELIKIKFNGRLDIDCKEHIRIHWNFPISSAYLFPVNLDDVLLIRIEFIDGLICQNVSVGQK